MKKFGLPEVKKSKDVFIPLEKFLQVINAFMAGGYVAYVKKSNMLKFGSEQYNTAINFIKNGSVTNDIMIDLYLLYYRAEQEKKRNSEKRIPIHYYLIDAFAKYECQNRKAENISSSLDTPEKINNIVNLYSFVTGAYYREYSKKYGVDYNKMIKQTVDYDILDSQRDTASYALG